MDGQGNLERIRKVREFENKWQAVLRKFVYSVQEGKDEHSPSTLGATRKGKN